MKHTIGKLMSGAAILLLALASAACDKGSDGEGAASGQETATAAVPESEAQAGHAAPHAEHAEHAAPAAPAEHAEPAAPAEHAEHAGHGEHGEEGGPDPMENVLAEGEYDPAALVSQPGAGMGDITRCPVSHEVFMVTADSPHVAYDDGVVYFCCPSCIRRFQRDPESFLNN